MSARFLVFALGFGAVTACSGAIDTGLFSNGDDTSSGADSGNVDASNGNHDAGGTMMDGGVMPQPDAAMTMPDAAPPQDAAVQHLDSGPPPDPGVSCPDTASGYCPVPDQSCCLRAIGTTSMPVGTCGQTGTCFQGVEVPCDNAAECNEIDPGQGEVCCGTTMQNGQNAVVSSVTCSSTDDCNSGNGVVLCDPNDPTACAGTTNTTTCRKSTVTLPGYYLCLGN